MEENISYEDQVLDLRTVTVVDYQITSFIGIIEEKRYHQHIFGSIYEVDEEGKRVKQAARRISATCGG
jgi:hypothetical protein